MKLSYLLLFLFVSSFASQALFILLPGFTATSQPLTTDQSHSSFLQPSSKVASESQTIDSFDVSPQNRYNITSSGNQTNTVDNSNLILTNYNNNSDSSYTATRQLTKTDSKVEWRSSSAVSGNTSEYFRDQLGTPMTFTSSTQGWINYGSATVSQVAGRLKVVSSTSYAGTYQIFPNYISKNIYTNISFQLQCSVSSNYQVYAIYHSGSTNYGSYAYTFTCSTLATTYNIPLSSFIGTVTREAGSFNELIFFPITVGMTCFLDNIQLVGSYNYPTLNQYPNNLGFDSSLEYFYDNYFANGSIMDFSNGYTGGFTALSGIISNSNNQYLNWTISSGSTDYLISPTVSIISATYKYFVFEIYSNVTIGYGTSSSGYYIANSAGTDICTTSALTITANKWNIIYCTGNSIWTGTTPQTQFRLYTVNPAAPILLSINFIGIYNHILGNLENTISSNAYCYINPLGYLQSRVTTASFPNIYYSSLSIDTSVYRYATISIKADSSNSRYFQIDVASGAVTPWTALTTSFQTFTFDLTSFNGYWTGTQAIFRIYFGSTGGGAAAPINSVFTIDYILLTATNQQQQPFQIGFVNPTTFVTTLNVTQVFFNASSFRWEVFLYTDYGTIAAYAYSNNQTYSSNTFYRGKIDFTVETSILEVKLTSDGGTNLFDAVYPDNFVVSDAQNTFFGLGSGAFPELYFSSQGLETGWSQTYLDFINAPFAEQNWHQASAVIPSIGSTTNFLTTPTTNAIISPLSSNFIYSIQGYEFYSLDIPQLDSATGTLNQINSNATFNWASPSVQDAGASTMCIYNVNPTNGSLLNLFCAQILHRYSYIQFYLFNYTNSFFNKYIIPGSTSLYYGSYKLYRLYTTNMYDSALDFNFRTINQRSVFQIQTRATFNVNDTSSNVYDFTYALNLTNVGLPYSNEYVVTYGNEIYFVYPTSAGQLTYSLNSWGFTARDIFAGIGSLVGVITSSNPVVSGFNWLANAINQVLMVGFRFLALTIQLTFTTAILPVYAELVVIYTSLLTIHTDLTNIYTYLGILGTIKTDLDNIYTAVSNLTNIKTTLDNIYTLLSGWSVDIGHIGDIYTLLSGWATAIGHITDIWSLLKVIPAAIWDALIGAAVWANYINPLVDHLITYVGSVLASIETNILQPLLTWLVSTVIIDILINGIIAAFSYGLSLLLAFLPWGLDLFVNQFRNVNITTLVTRTVNLINWVLALNQVGLNIFFLALTAFIFALPFVANKFELGPSVQGVLRNAFTLHGWDLTTGFGNATIPVRINAILVWTILATVITVNGVALISYFIPIIPW